MSKINGLITPDQAKELDANYTQRYNLVSRDITKRDDNRSNWFSIEELEAYIAHAKAQAKNKFKVELSGIRIYNGAYEAENDKGGYSTVFLIPTSENSLGKDGNGDDHPDIQGADGLNFSDPGDPPGANYPQ